MNDFRLRVNNILTKHGEWMTVAEVQKALTPSAPKLRVRLALDTLVAEERAVCRTNPQRQYRSQLLGGARSKPPKRLSDFIPLPMPV